MVMITYKGQTKNIPKKYIPDSLTETQRKKQIKSIFENKERPKLQRVKRRSSYTVRFNKIYGSKLDKLEGGRNIKNISKVTGLPYKALKKVFEKGEGAYYSSGSRPNQSPQSWAYARLYSYILGGGAREVDKDITKKYNVVFTHIKN